MLHTLRNGYQRNPNTWNPEFIDFIHINLIVPRPKRRFGALLSFSQYSNVSAMSL